MVKKKPHASGIYFLKWFVRSYFVARNLDPCLFMSKTVICVEYVYDCLFWERSQSNIDNNMIYLKEYGPSYNWEHSKGD